MKYFKNFSIINNTIATSFFVVAMVLFISSCGEKESKFDEIKIPRDNQARLNADSISTIISDSGITRFRISTPKWLIYDRTNEPYWLFPKGILFEKFNETYNIDARMKADTAIYHENNKLWEFNGNVSAKNLEGEEFKTQQMFWDNTQERFYSDKEIHIKQKDKIIIGIGFESNSTMTQYTIRNPKGIFPIEEK